MGLFGRKYFDNVDQAKEFLIEKVAVESYVQGIALNEHERKALNYAADEPSTEWGIDWEKVRKSSEGKDYEGQAFEQEMSGLLKAAYERDKKSNPADVPKYKSALRMFSEETNWICSIAQQAIDPANKSKTFNFTFGS